MKAIAVATVTGRCLPVFLASIDAYVPTDVAVYIAGSDAKLPRHRTHNIANTATNFGDIYNELADLAFKHHDSIVVANDDVVLDPDTWTLLNEDWTHLHRFNRLGWLSCRSDRVRPGQQFWRIDPTVAFEVSVMSPLFAAISKEAWQPFPPINWYSDDVSCVDLSQKGYHHYISRGFVHHVGSSTIGQDNSANALAAEPWIREHRPELHELWFPKT